MQAVVLTKPKTLQLLDIPKPVMTEKNHVLIRVEACGICGSDLRYWAGENPWALHTLGKHVDNPPNMVMGHEFSGVVEAVNSSEYEHLLGKRVGVQSYRVCGKCNFCTTGRENLCRDMIHIGHAQGWGDMEYFPGGYAEYCLGWADLLHPLDDDLDFASAAMADILCVAVHVSERVRIYDGANVLCIGGGPAGLGIAQVVETLSNVPVYISDPSPIAQNVLANYPQFTVIDPATVDLNEYLLEKNIKFAAIFDSVGSGEMIQNLLPLLEEGGTWVNMAVHDTPVNMNAMALGSERTLTTSSNAFNSDLVRAYQLLNTGKLDVSKWITHTFPLDEFEQAFELLLQQPKAAFKVVFEPWKAD